MSNTQSPDTTKDKLVLEDELENGHDGMPDEIWQDLKKNERFIYWSLMFLNGSVLWAYYSCLTAQDYYTVVFADTDLDFSFLTTLVTSWPMVLGVGLQLFFGLDKMISQDKRMYIGYGCFMASSALIMIFSGIGFSNATTGGVLVLICFGIIGFCNTLTEATFYQLAALFPIEKFTNAVQIGNGLAGVLNVTLSTILRLIVGGISQEKQSTELAFYLFFSLLICVLIAAVFLYRRVIALPCVKFLMDRNDNDTSVNKLNEMSFGDRMSNLSRVFKVIWVPCIAQWLVFFVSLSTYPGFGCAAARNFTTDFASEANADIQNWFCTPGIIGSYNYGDFFGRMLATPAVYGALSMLAALALTVVRIAYIPLFLVGIAGTSLYGFGVGDMGAVAYLIILNVTLGLSNGLLSTVTVGKAPRLLESKDRETGGSISVFFLFLGIASGSLFGFIINNQGLFGL